MTDTLWSKSLIVMRVCWILVVALQVGAWGIVIGLPDHRMFAWLLEAASCALSGLAAALMVRGYAVRTCAMLRALHGGESVDRARALHTVT